MLAKRFWTSSRNAISSVDASWSAGMTSTRSGRHLLGVADNRRPECIVPLSNPVSPISRKYSGLSADINGSDYFQIDGHWNRWGHEKAAKAITSIWAGRAKLGVHVVTCGEVPTWVRRRPWLASRLLGNKLPRLLNAKLFDVRIFGNSFTSVVNQRLFRTDHGKVDRTRSHT